jgi:hypothetical protein
MTAMSGASRSARAAYDKKEQTPLPSFDGKAPTGISRWIFRCFRHTSRKALGLENVRMRDRKRRGGVCLRRLGCG